MFPPRVFAAVMAIALVVAPGSALAAPLSEDFESGATGWATTGLFRSQPHPETVAVSPAIGGILTDVPAGASLPAAWTGTGVAWFGDPSTGTYCAGYSTVAQHPSDGCRSAGRVEGTLTSPPFALPGPQATLDFHAWWEIAAAEFEVADLMTAEYSTDGGATWTTAERLNPSGAPFGSLHQPYTSGGLRAPPSWRAYRVDLSPAIGSAAVRIRFHFDSVDEVGQGFRGLLIDDVAVEGSQLREATPALGAGLAPGATGQPEGLPSGAVRGRTIVIEPVSGRSAYTTPGTRQRIPLVRATVVPVGTLVDARDGAVRVTTATDATGGTQSGTFHDGEFAIHQAPDAALVELALRGGRFPHCDTGCTSELRHRSSVRHLWGNARGAFSTRGRYAAATVRGTNWLVEDQPGATLVKVRRGTTLVRDFVRDRDIIVNAGESYVARVVYTNRERSNPRFGQQYTLAVRDGRIVHVYRTRRIMLNGR
jgi:hypothetical protein